MASERGWARAGLLLALASGLVGSLAHAAEPVIVPGDDVLRPGRATVVYVAASSEAELPPLSVEGGEAERIGRLVDGIEAWRVRSALDAESLHLRLQSVERVLPVELPPPSDLRLPRLIDGQAGGGPVVFHVEADGVPPEALQVAVGEGSVLGVVAREGGLEVRVQPDDSPFPRVVPVGVRDARRDELPVWGHIRLEARPVLPVETEPGARVRIEIGGRRYGPYVADASGQVRPRVRQLPGEGHAVAVLGDGLGNETWVEIPLALATRPQLAALPEGEILPGEPVPPVWLKAVRADGAPFPEPPVCRTSAGELPVRTVEHGLHLLAPRPVGGDLVVDCALGESVHRFRVPLADGVPARIRTRVWPAEMRADHPVAEILAVLEDGRGAVLPPHGLVLRAERGQVDVAVEGQVLRGEYRGHAVVSSGSDAIVARWHAEGSGSWAERIDVGWSVAHDGGVLLHARALDPRRLPVADVPLTFEVGGRASYALTGSDGWATARFPGPRPSDLEIVRVVGPFGGHTAPVLPGTSWGAPGTPDLVARESLRILPGQTVGIALEVVPPVLRAGPGARARIHVTLEDRAGKRVDDRPVELRFSTGEVGTLHRRPDGSFVAEYDPGRVDHAREIVVTAQTEDLRSSTTFRVEPRRLRLAVGPWFGMHSNLGAVTSPIGGIEGEVRVRSTLLGDSAAMRVDVGSYRFEHELENPLLGALRMRSRVVPVTATLGFRQHAGQVDLMAGAGGALAVHTMDLELAAEHYDGAVLLAGPVVMVGAARELLGGELTWMLRGTWLIQSRGEFGYHGNVGGLTSGLGYRLVF